jgi:hypothetical protein
VFVHRDFAGFTVVLPLIEAGFRDSVVASGVSGLLLEAIRMNLVVNMVRPCAGIRFRVIESELELARSQIVGILRASIREGKLEGKLDLVEDQFVATDEGVELREMLDLFNRTMIVKESFTLSEWGAQFVSQRDSRQTGFWSDG